MLRTSVQSIAIALAAFVMFSSSALAAEPVEKSLALAELSDGDVVTATTATARYRFEIVNAETGEALGQVARGDEAFGAAHRVYLLGSTQGREAAAAGMMFVQMHRIRVGMKLELGVHSLKQSDRQLTAPIETISVTRVNQDHLAMLVR